MDAALVVPLPTVWAVAVGLGAVAVMLAWPVPIVLARAAWPTKSPVVALLLWQLIGLAGGFSMIGALSLAGLALLPELAWWGQLPAVALAAYLLIHLAVTLVQVIRQRRQHLAVLDMLTSPHPVHARTRVIEDGVPVAYCLPRGAGSVTVLSRGLLNRLSADELAAVIAHERAHVEQRHDILLIAFRAWRSALPWFPIAARAEAEVAALVEMLADDHARREVRDEVLARAILSVQTSRPGGAGIAPVEAPSSRMSDRFWRLSA